MLASVTSGGSRIFNGRGGESHRQEDRGAAGAAYNGVWGGDILMRRYSINFRRCATTRSK